MPILVDALFLTVGTLVLTRALVWWRDHEWRRVARRNQGTDPGHAR